MKHFLTFSRFKKIKSKQRPKTTKHYNHHWVISARAGSFYKAKGTVRTILDWQGHLIGVLTLIHTLELYKASGFSIVLT